MSNRNTEYEILVADIHQAMLRHDGYENLRVEHDVSITGKSGATHQIDVYWEFIAAETVYRTCVECKNYKSSVKKTHVAAFASVLDDIGNANGIIATTGGFQKGAKLLAKERNIRLILVNNLLRTIHITSRPRIPSISKWEVIFDHDMVSKVLQTIGKEEYTFHGLFDGEHPLLNEDGEPATTFNKFIYSHSLKEGPNTLDASALYLETEIGALRLKEISFTLTHLTFPPMESIIPINNDSNAVLEDIVSNNKYYLNDDGTVSRKNAS